MADGSRLSCLKIHFFPSVLRFCTVSLRVFPSQDMPLCAQWWDVDKMKLLDHLHWGKANGFQADSGWKPQIWAYCAVDLARTPGGEKTANKCKDQYQGVSTSWQNLSFTNPHRLKRTSQRFTRSVA
jgi:hypothetical protein